MSVSGNDDDVILLTAPSSSNSILDLKDSNIESLQLTILRQLITYCTSLDLPADDDTTRPSTSTPVRPIVEDNDYIDILLSIITAITDCIVLGVVEDNNPIINDLFHCKRPSHPFFSRVYRKSENGLPPEVLATFCDVAVIKFLMRCNEHSSHQAVEWCLQYLLKIFSTLDPILQRSGSGWYNAKMKVRKASSIDHTPLVMTFNNNNQEVGRAAASCDQNAQPRRRRSGCMIQPYDNSVSLQQAVTLTLDSSTSPSATAGTVSHSASSRSKRPTFKPPSMVTIAEEPDIISSNTIDMSIVRFSPDLTEPCNNGNNPLVCLPQPDSLPSSPTSSLDEADLSSKRKTVRFDVGEIDLVEYELQSGVSCEGRIGLIAILNAIAKLPVKMATNKINIERKATEENSVWNETMCAKVFTLIQKCINSSMFIEQDDKATEDTDTPHSASNRRKAFGQTRSKFKQGMHQKSLLATYSDHVMHFSFKAIVQCALFIRCSACTKHPVKDAALCKQLHDKLSTICTHSSFKKRYLRNFVKTEPVGKVLAFLHAALGFCKSAINDDELGHWYEYKVKIVVSVLKSLLDKMVCLDLTESSIKAVTMCVCCSIRKFCIMFTLLGYGYNALPYWVMGKMHYLIRYQ